jgi:hypothetical protein
MNNAMLATALEAIKNPEFVAQLSAQMLARQELRAAFARGDVFSRMVNALKSQGNVAVDNQEVAYFPDRVRAQTGWDFATEEDMTLFFAVISDSYAETVVPGSRGEDEDNPFCNCHFEHFGLHVRVMSGQGTFISVSTCK